MKMLKDHLEQQLKELKPEKFSVQKTKDESYFFTLIFSDKTIFLEHFFENNEDEENTVITIFSAPDKKHISSHAGSFHKVYSELLTIKNLNK